MSNLQSLNANVSAFVEDRLINGELCLEVINRFFELAETLIQISQGAMC
ncbi:unannotated protein [freshwater metagenome]|uniref:Unannotated protein n=1 Tax=freshwater metagenome TaxID=449393 RepID=A0A6J7DDH5_9ZZZZ